MYVLSKNIWLQAAVRDILSRSPQTRTWALKAWWETPTWISAFHCSSLMKEQHSVTEMFSKQDAGTTSSSLGPAVRPGGAFLHAVMQNILVFAAASARSRPSHCNVSIRTPQQRSSDTPPLWRLKRAESAGVPLNGPVVSLGSRQRFTRPLKPPWECQSQ